MITFDLFSFLSLSKRFLLIFVVDYLFQVQSQVLPEIGELVLFCVFQPFVLLNLNQHLHQLQIFFALFSLYLCLLLSASVSFVSANKIGNVVDPLEWSWKSGLFFQELSLQKKSLKILSNVQLPGSNSCCTSSFWWHFSSLP